MKKGVISLFVMFLVFGLIVLNISGVEAGIGIKKYKESMLVGEGEKGCVVVGAYNPFSTDTNVIIGVTDPIKDVLVLQEAKTKLLPAGTSSDEAINMEFCFKVPTVYERDCKVGSFLCAVSCNEEQKVYDGEIYLRTVPLETSAGGIGGSSTSMSVSQDMKVRVRCDPHPTDYTLLYVLIALISLLVIGIVIFRKYRKPKSERIKEKMQELKKEMKSVRKASPKKKPVRKKK